MRFDHRPAVAIARREKMRARIIEAAVLVIAGKGVANTVIEDVVAQAGVSRGTFYNYFAAVPDLMQAAHEELSNEILIEVEAAVRDISDPASRFAHGIFLFMNTAVAYPLMGHLVSTIGNVGVTDCSVIHQLVPRHFAEGIASGDFCNLPLRVVTDLLASAISTSLSRKLTGEAIDMPEIVAALLRGMGVSRERAEELGQLKLQPLVLSQEGLVARSNAIWLRSR